MRLLVYDVHVIIPDERNIIIPICLEKNTIKNYWDILQDEYIWSDLPLNILTQNTLDLINNILIEEYGIDLKDCKISKLVRDINKEMS